MIKYYSSSVVFQEVPDEITLALEITSCPHRCPECHSPWLREDIGVELTAEECLRLIGENPGVSCICFMGGDANHEGIASLAREIKERSGLKVAMYSGDEKMDPILASALDYYKIGPYIKERGPLDSPSTNQVFYKMEGGKAIDITHRFFKKKIGDIR